MLFCICKNKCINLGQAQTNPHSTTFIQNNTIVKSQGEDQDPPKDWFRNSIRRKKKVLNEVNLDEYPGFNELKEEQVEEKVCKKTVDEQ